MFAAINISNNACHSELVEEGRVPRRHRSASGGSKLFAQRTKAIAAKRLSASIPHATAEQQTATHPKGSQYNHFLTSPLQGGDVPKSTTTFKLSIPSLEGRQTVTIKNCLKGVGLRRHNQRPIPTFPLGRPSALRFAPCLSTILSIITLFYFTCNVISFSLLKKSALLNFCTPLSSNRSSLTTLMGCMYDRFFSRNGTL